MGKTDAKRKENDDAYTNTQPMPTKQATQASETDFQRVITAMLQEPTPLNLASSTSSTPKCYAYTYVDPEVDASSI